MNVLRIFGDRVDDFRPILIPTNQIKYVKRSAVDVFPIDCDAYNACTVVLVDGEIINGFIPQTESIIDVLSGGEK